MCNYTDIVYHPEVTRDCLCRIEAKENDNEELHTVAFINRLTGIVTYVDPKDEFNPSLQEPIRKIIKELDPKITIADQQHTAVMYCQTDLGKFVLQFEQHRHTGAGYDGAFIGFLPSCCEEDEYFDLVSARAFKPDTLPNQFGELCIALNAYDDPCSEDATFTEYIFENMFKYAADTMDH